MVDQQSFGIGELAEVAGITVRAVRYYISLGLLPPPNEKGSSASYGDEHLERLHLIEELKERRLSLSEINRMLSTLSRREIAELISSALPPDAGSVAGFSEVREMLTTPPASPRAAESQGDHYMAESSPPPAGTGETETWVRLRITDGIEIHHKASLLEDEEAKLFDLVSRARAMFRATSRATGPHRGRSRFFHRKQSNCQGDK